MKNLVCATILTLALSSGVLSACAHFDSRSRVPADVCKSKGPYSPSGVAEDIRPKIQAVVDSHVNELRSCYQNKLDRGIDMEGYVVARWDISPKGSVENVKLVRTNLREREFVNCVAKNINGWQFESRPTDLTIEVCYPFVFTIEKHTVF